MKQVFTDQNIALVGSVRSYLQDQGIACQLRNEHTSSVMGEVSFFLVWPEIWVADADAAQALELLKEIRKPLAQGEDWVCANCQERNPVTFEVCWQCNTANRHSD